MATILASGCGGDPVNLTWTVNASFPHQEEGAYTQGLEFYKGFLLEGTGNTNESDWRIVNLDTGEVCYRHGIPSGFFGEGITVMNDRLYQVTWRDRVGLEYDLSGLGLDALDPATVKPSDFEGKRARAKQRYKYRGEGWGLTNDGTHLIMSTGNKDGKLHFFDADFKPAKTLVVKDEDGDPVPRINELEFVDGHIWANIFQTNFIIKIDASSGQVVGRADMTELLSEEERATLAERDRKAGSKGYVLNGIARDPATGKMYVTGKNWPKIFQVSFADKP